MDRAGMDRQIVATIKFWKKGGNFWNSIYGWSGTIITYHSGAGASKKAGAMVELGYGICPAQKYHQYLNKKTLFH